jgi:hypothetical protein
MEASMMKLIGLQPRWLEADGERVGFIFHCPHCVAGASTPPTWLSCFLAPAPKISRQFEIFRLALARDPRPMNRAVVPITEGVRWVCRGEQNIVVSPLAARFEDLTVDPSIDASASGHWHGHIKGGVVK